MPSATSSDDDDPPFAQPIQLVGGVNFTTWPDLKWSRGNSHVALLQAKFNEWHASAPVSVGAVLREDALGIDLVARVPKGIPRHEWSLDLGDALHNLRSAFDAVAWGMAHFDGAEPARPKSVTFPICVDEAQWQKALKAWVNDIQPAFQERLRTLQPYTYAPVGGTSVLSILHDLDIRDKHREMLTVSVDLQGMNLTGSFEYDDPKVAVEPRVEMRTGVKFADGAVLGTLHAGASIRQVGEMLLRPLVKVQLSHQDNTYDVLPLLQQLTIETRRYLDILLFGLATEDGLVKEDWVPMTAEIKLDEGWPRP